MDLKTQVQERVGEEPEGPPGEGGLIYYPLPEILQRKEAFFSVPLAEESQPLFAFIYQAPDVSFTKAMGKLKNLREEVTKNAGADMHTWDWFNSLFGSWGQWLTKMGIVVMFLLLFCCIVPFIRSMLASATAKQMINVSVRPTGIDVGCTNMYTVGPGLDELDEFV